MVCHYLQADTAPSPLSRAVAVGRQHHNTDEAQLSGSYMHKVSQKYSGGRIGALCAQEHRGAVVAAPGHARLLPHCRTEGSVSAAADE
jgi:phage terminase large subunit-like protein